MNDADTNTATAPHTDAAASVTDANEIARAAASHADANEIAMAAIAKIRAESPRDRTRLLSVLDVEMMILAHLRHVAEHPGEEIRSHTVGGYVPNSYGYRAYTDKVTVTTTATGEFSVVAERTTAQCRAHGSGYATIHRALRPGQTQGRLIASE